MVDTIRDRAALLALLADNTVGAISPQDLRDAIVSLHGVHACLTFTPLTAIAATPVEAILKPWAAGFVNSGVTVDATNGRLTALTAGTYMVRFNVSVDIPDTVPMVPTYLTFALGKNGVVIVANGGTVFLGIPANSPAAPVSDKRIHTGSFGVLVTLDAADYLEIRYTGSNDNLVNVWSANFSMERVA